jgi:hypothetical protein
VQIQTDPRYVAFVERAAVRDVLGIPLPVAALDDVLQGKIWAATDVSRRPSKRRKDLLDIERILESYLDLRPRVPARFSRSSNRPARAGLHRAQRDAISHAPGRCQSSVIVPSNDPVVVRATGSNSRCTTKLPVAPANRPVPPVIVACSSIEKIG